TVSETWRHRRGAGDADRAKHRSAVPVLPVALRDRANTDCDQSDSYECECSAAIAASVLDRDSAICDCGRKLDRDGAHREHLRVGRAGQLYDCDSHPNLCAAAKLGIEQCRGNTGRTKSWRETARTRGGFGVAHGLI